MHIATQWDIWYAGLLPKGTPEPPGRRSNPEIIALRAEADRNFAEACFAANQSWKERHGGRAGPKREKTEEFSHPLYGRSRFPFP